MKRRFTTPVLKSLATKAALVVIASIVGITTALMPVTPTKAVSTTELDSQIKQLQGEINQYQAQAKDLRSKGDTIQTAVDALSKDIAAIQAQVDLTQAKVDQLKADITLNEQKILFNQDDLGKTIANIYVDDKISPLEMLASSKNISDYVDKQEYRATVRDRLTGAITEIKQLKKELEKQKIDVERELGQQKNTQAALDGKRGEQQQLLNQTRGDEAAYQRLTADSKARQDQLAAQYRAAMRATFRSAGGATVLSQGVVGDYPWSASNCPMRGYFSLGGANGIGGDGHGYGCRQCASYAAWRVSKEAGVYPESWGNATNFPQSARNMGYRTGYSPDQNATVQLAVMHSGKAGVPEGHVVYVENVSGDMLEISQYNYDYGAGYGMYSSYRLSASAYDEFITIK